MLAVHLPDHLQFRMLDSQQLASGDLHSHNQVICQLVGCKPPTWQNPMLEFKSRPEFYTQLVTLRPTFRGTVCSVMQHDCFRNKHQTPVGLRYTPAPLVVFRVHVKSFVKAADLIDHLTPCKNGRPS